VTEKIEGNAHIPAVMAGNLLADEAA